MPKFHVFYTLLAAASLSSPVFACSSCGCSTSSDWVNRDVASDTGTTLSLRYDYVPQTQLRSGTSAIDRASITLPTTREIEQYSYNHYITLGADHVFDSHWALNVQLPYVQHPHLTVSPGDTDTSASDTRGLGDVRLVGRYQIKGAAAVSGLQFGLKLPTGGFHQSFQSGPSAGEPVDRGLQAGTGTTHLLFGAYRYGALARNVDYLVQVQGEVPLNTRDDYRPGLSGTASFGLSYTRWHIIKPKLELNLHAAGQDHGANADRDNSGGVALSLSPGVTVPLNGHLSAFAALHVPLYEQVNGYQLAPKASASAGLSMRL